jgi:hypothetical protein
MEFPLVVSAEPDAVGEGQGVVLRFDAAGGIG